MFMRIYKSAQYILYRRIHKLSVLKIRGETILRGVYNFSVVAKIVHLKLLAWKAILHWHYWKLPPGIKLTAWLSSGPQHTTILICALIAIEAIYTFKKNQQVKPNDTFSITCSLSLNWYVSALAKHNCKIR